MPERRIEKTVAPKLVSDGAGVRIKRLIGTPDLDHVDPFLLFDEFGSDKGADYAAGFPDHPHRGMETVTYMLAGRMRHGDNQGNRGDLGPGDVQWMTAGRGLVHSEMPQQEDGLMRGFQIWVNLPAAQKMASPRYQDVPDATILRTEPAPGVTAKVIAGRFDGVEGAITGIAAEPLYLDLNFAGTGSLAVPVPPGHSAIVYAYEGAVDLGPDRLAAGHLAVLGDGEAVRIATHGPAKAVLLAAKPFGEPIARYGPFVMNSKDEIAQALADYRAGRF